MPWRASSIISRLLGVNPAVMEERFREAERSVEEVLEPPIALRLDGVGFGEALEGFRWPRDRRVHEALVEAGRVIMERFNARLVYVASDEINAVITGELPYSGRLEKLVSISAGIASSIVSLRLGRSLYFDSRVVPLRDENDAMLYLAFRERVALNNYVNSLLRGLGVRVEKLRGGLRERLEMLEGMGVDPLSEPWAALGTCITRVNATRELQWLSVRVERSRVVEVDGGCLALYSYSSSKETT